MTRTDNAFAWWERLRHAGLILSPAVMQERYAEPPAPLPWHAAQKLRDAYTGFSAVNRLEDEDASKRALDAASILEWTDTVFERALEIPPECLLKQNAIPPAASANIRVGGRSETLKPHRVVVNRNGGMEIALPVMADTSPRLGIGRGRTAYAKFLELLRATGRRLGLLTNGVGFRLVYAGLDFESWCEWDAARWIEDAKGAEERDGFRLLLSPASLIPQGKGAAGLLDAVEESRKKQADLSNVLRENVRQAVELILDEASKANRGRPDLLDPVRRAPGGGELSDRAMHYALMQAAMRVVMRMVVALFAESRGLLPVDDPVYERAYGVRALYEQLDGRVRRQGGAYSLVNARAAWPRLWALFRMVHAGSGHTAFPLQAYGGALFKPGGADDPDETLRALHVLERDVAVSDAVVWEVLRKLLRGPLPVMRGRSKTCVEGPVDYTGLRTEFIGLIYEGLLDYRLKRAEDGSPQVFLNLGREPVLPLARLEDMLEREPNRLRDLIDKLKKEKASKTAEAGGDEEEEETGAEAEEEEAPEDETEDGEPAAEAEETAAEAVRDELNAEADERALAWARKAIEVAKLAPKKRKRETETAFRQRVEDDARRLIKRTIAPGEFYLVRAGNTRKGTGTFYTRPQLAVPTVRRTLEPLCTDAAPAENGAPAGRVPKRPEDILALKVCDPACGSASFLVAALHYLTDRLYESLCFHCGLDDTGRSVPATLPFGKPSTGDPGEELPPLPPGHEDFTARVKAILRRHVVERCIYGVDLNPLAVELARVSLWVETLDRDLPFTFLDHKIKVGNSLVGCWLDRVADYPICAWNREGGDGKNGARTEAIETLLKGNKEGGRRGGTGVVKSEMIRIIESRLLGQTIALGEEYGTDLDGAMREARGHYEQMHQMRAHDAAARETHYREHILNSPAIARLRGAMDEWCAVWFWPMDEESARHAPTPAVFHKPSPEAAAIVRRLADDMRFFHWEIEFPDVFTPGRAGFDVTLGNPPWETIQQESMEFFTDYDPIYRAYDKQTALRRQESLFNIDPTIKMNWLNYCGNFAAMSNWIENCSNPYDVSLSKGRRNKDLQGLWKSARDKRTGYANQNHPFVYQGSGKKYTYKLFVEFSYYLVGNNGRMGIIIPSGLYTDSGTTELRTLFFDQSGWDWLFSFENRRKIFDIHGSFKFASTIVDRRKGRAPLKAAFMVRELKEWEKDLPPVFEFNPELIPLFSPRSRSIPEVRTGRDLDICRKIYGNSIRVGDNAPGWEIKYSQEINMTSDSKHFKPREKWEEKGYRPDPFGRWIGPGGEVALPLYEGRMVGQFDFSEKGYVSGRGRSAEWRPIPFDDKRIEPQYLMAEETYLKWDRAFKGIKLAIMDITSSTNSRTAITCPIIHAPANHKVPVFIVNHGELINTLCLCAIMNSLTYDYMIRNKFGGLSLTWFVLEESPIPEFDYSKYLSVALRTMSLAFVNARYAPEWLKMFKISHELKDKDWKHWWAVTEADRLRLRVEVDALCADLYGLEPDDFEWIVRDDPDDPKGFWRVDKHLPYEERLTGLAARAFLTLKNGQWSAETAAAMDNDQFFEAIGVPEITNGAAAKAKGLDRPLIFKREGCHRWAPENFAEDDPRHGWTWDHCRQDALALLGSEEALEAYLNPKPETGAGDPNAGGGYLFEV